MAKKATTLLAHEAEFLAEYGDILNSDGLDSPRERAFLAERAGDAEVLKLLRCARALQAMFDAFGDFPELPPRGGQRKGKSSK